MHKASTCTAASSPPRESTSGLNTRPPTFNGTHGAHRRGASRAGGRTSRWTSRTPAGTGQPRKQRHQLPQVGTDRPKKHYSDRGQRRTAGARAACSDHGQQHGQHDQLHQAGGGQPKQRKPNKNAAGARAVNANGPTSSRTPRTATTRTTRTRSSGRRGGTTILNRTRATSRAHLRWSGAAGAKRQSMNGQGAHSGKHLKDNVDFSRSTS